MSTAHESLRVTGKIKIDTYRTGMVDCAAPILDQLRVLRQGRSYKASYKYQQLLQTLKQIKDAHFIGTAVDCPNLVVDSANYGLDLIIQRLVGINTYSLNLSWIEIGTGVTTPTAADTGLTTPSVRAAINFQEDFATTDAIVQAYITDANLPNATYNEVGAFVDGNSSIGTGQLFNHSVLSSPYVKASGQDTTIQVDIALSNS